MKTFELWHPQSIIMYSCIKIITMLVALQIYPYLVVNDACLTESRREERVLQLLRMLNHFLAKQKVRPPLSPRYHVNSHWIREEWMGKYRENAAPICVFMFLTH